MWPNGLFDVVSHGSRSDSFIYLTFDDGPDPYFTPQVLELLDAYNVAATFFVLGSMADIYPKVVQRLWQAGHEVGCHGYSHRHPWLLNTQQAIAEVKRAVDSVTEAGGHRPKVFRPAFGRLRPSMLNAAKAHGLTTMLWSRSGIDWGGFGKEFGIRRRLSKTKQGDIVLLHDAPRTQNNTAVMLKELPRFIDQCREKGYRFAKCSNLVDNLPQYLRQGSGKRA